MRFSRISENKYTINMQFVFDKKVHLTKLAHRRFFNVVKFLKKVFDGGWATPVGSLRHILSNETKQWQIVDQQIRDI